MQKVWKEGQERNLWETDHDLAWVEAKPMPTMMDLG